LGLLAKKHNTTPLALAGKVKAPVAEPPTAELVEKKGWLGRLWEKVKGERPPSLTLTSSETPEPTSEPEDYEKAEPEKAEPELAPTDMAKPEEPAASTESVDTAPEEKLPPEGDGKDTREDPLHEEEETTLRLLPTDSRLADLPTAADNIGKADEVAQFDAAGEVDEVTEIREIEPVEREPVTPPPQEPPRTEGAPRPRAIHKGVPIYEEEGFHFELRREVAKCQRLGRPLTLILIRVMDLDQIVELVGAGFRRQVLWHVAEQALESLRDVDVAGELSSQELVGLIAFASGRYGGRRIVSRVKRSVARHPFRVGEGLPAIVPALRFGIAAFPKEAKDIDALMEHARRELAS
jgi:GGDEF domain-containing protein